MGRPDLLAPAPADALPDELQQRLDALRQGPGDPVNPLLEAVLSVGRELDLPQVLRRIVEAAVVLVDAEYGALGVVSEGTRLSHFLPVGVTDAQQQAIGRLPEGHGLLGELIRHPRPLRLPHPAAVAGAASVVLRPRPGVMAGTVRPEQEGQGRSGPAADGGPWAARTAAWIRRSTPSAASRREIWLLTVSSERWSLRAI